MRHFKLNIRLALLAILAVTFIVLSFQQTTRGQADGILPWIVSTTPSLGAELPVDQDVTFIFNAAMNRASVEAAFSVTPSAPGTFQWKDDASLKYVPDKPLDRDTAYIFQIDSNARSIEGVPLRDTFALKLHTTGYLMVTQFFPEDQGYGIELRPTITIVFNRPVVPLGTATQMQNMAVPFISNPALTGNGEWLTTSIYSFKVTDDLKGDTEYKVTLPKTLTDVGGSSLKADTTFKFKTVSLATPTPKTFGIHYVTPQDKQTGVFRNPLIRIGFDSPADVASAEAGFSLLAPDGRSIPGKFEWKDDKNELQFRPGERLDYSTS